MNINRNNYETFFLLYIDNELPVAERKAVELFLQENPDLEIEFQSLKETVLIDEPLKFDIKNSLFKPENDKAFSEEDLLLYLDKELEPVLAEKLDAALLADVALMEQWQVLQQTKLDPGVKYIFQDKKSLYRYERGRVIGFRYWRAAAAAVLLLISLYTGNVLVKNNKIIETGTAISPSVKPGQLINSNIGVKPAEKIFDNTEKVLPQDIAREKNELPVNIAKANKQENDPAETKNKNDQQNNLAQRNQTLPKPGLENINSDNSNKLATLDVTDKNKEIIIKNKKPSETANVTVKEKIVAPSPLIDYNSIPPMPDSYARTAVMTEPVPENDNKILYISEERIARSKIGGLFRKVKRVIERNTNIKTGNGVRIAGFEIAVK